MSTDNELNSSARSDNEQNFAEVSSEILPVAADEVSEPQEKPTESLSPKSPPAIPERWELDGIPKAYTLGYDCNRIEQDPLADPSQSAAETERSMPPIPEKRPLSTDKVTSHSSTLDHSSDSERSIPPRPQSHPPNPPLPATLPPDLSAESIDELIGLAPSKDESAENNPSLFQKMGRSLSKVKGQTSTVWSRIAHRSSAMGDDLLDLENAPSSVSQEFPANPTTDLVPPTVPEPTNDDVITLFGMPSAVLEEGDSEEEEVTSRRRSGSIKSSVESLLDVLAVSRMVSQRELGMLITTVPSEKIKIRKVVRSFVEEFVVLRWLMNSGKTKEFNQMIHRADCSLPHNELRAREVKDGKGNRMEIKRIAQLSFTVPQVFVFKDTFLFRMERRQNKLNFLSKWSAVFVQLNAQQIRLYQNLADIEQEVTIARINLHALMMISPVMRKNYKSEMMCYCKLFENDLLNRHVLEERPESFRKDLPHFLSLKVGSKNELIVRAFVHQLSLRLTAICHQEKAHL